jgi:hypothetical protein
MIPAKKKKIIVSEIWLKMSFLVEKTAIAHKLYKKKGMKVRTIPRKHDKRE